MGSPKLLYRKAFYEFEMDEGKRGVWKGKDGVEGRVKESAGSTRRTVTREEVLFRAEKLVAKSKPGFSTWGNEASPTPSPSPARGRRQARQSPPIRRSARMGQNSSPSRNAPIKTEGETRESATAIAAVEGEGESVASNVTLGREVEAEARSAISVASSRTLGRSDESAVSSAALGRANVVSSATVMGRAMGLRVLGMCLRGHIMRTEGWEFVDC